MKIFKRFAFLLLLFVLYTFVCAFSYANTVSEDLSNSVFRLHILANSDSEEDQNLKLAVRDNILSYMKEISSDVSSKEDVISLVNEHLNDFYSIARETIVSNGYDYDVRLSIDKFDFPTKVYGDIALPAGLYDALRIEIGEANGHNWWCVMFPTLCFVDVSSGSLDDEAKSVLESNLNDEEFEIVSKDNETFGFKFKILEFFDNIRVTLASK
ncbi:MAG: stage II sporulation protein R [Clostridia bacterium]|jgi:stage II sporulation protein R|nr:stage II sporulation protein R [Clostridia bacterium]